MNKLLSYIISIQTFPSVSAVIFKHGELLCGISNDRLKHFSRQEMAGAAIHYLCSSQGILPEKVGQFIHSGWETDFSGKALLESLKRHDIPLTRYSLMQISPDLSSAFYTLNSKGYKDGVFFYFSTQCFSLYEFKSGEIIKLDLELDKNDKIQSFIQEIYEFLNIDTDYLKDAFKFGNIEKYNELKRYFSFDPNGRVYATKDATAFFKDNYNHDSRFDWLLAFTKLTEDIFIHYINYIKYITGKDKLFISGDISHLFTDKKLRDLLPLELFFDNIPENSPSLGGMLYYKWHLDRPSEQAEKEKISRLAETMFERIKNEKIEYLKTFFNHNYDPILLAFQDAFKKCSDPEMTFKIEEITLNEEGNIAWLTFLFFIFGHDSNNYPYIVNHKGMVYFKKEVSGWEDKGVEFTVFRNDPILTVELTNKCNFKCIMCDQSKELNRKSGFMNVELFDRIIESLDNFPVSTITPFWLGESTLNKDFGTFIKRAFSGNRNNSRFFNMTLNTNGSLFDKQISDTILECAGMDDQNISSFLRVHFSIDSSSRETYKKIHSNDCFEKTMNNIRYFLEERKRLGLEYPKVTLAFIIMPENRDEAKDFLEMGKKLFSDMGNDFVITYDWPAYNKDAIYFRRLDSLNQKQSEELHREVLEEIGIIEKKPQVNERIIVTDSILKEDITPEPKFVRRPCPGLWKTPIINWDGEVTVCCFDVNMVLKVGNIKEQSLKEIWDSAQINYWRLCHIRGEFDKIPLCAQCANLNAPTMKNADFVRYLLSRGMKSEIQPFLERVGAGL